MAFKPGLDSKSFVSVYIYCRKIRVKPRWVRGLDNPIYTGKDLKYITWVWDWVCVTFGLTSGLGPRVYERLHQVRDNSPAAKDQPARQENVRPSSSPEPNHCPGTAHKHKCKCAHTTSRIECSIAPSLSVSLCLSHIHPQAREHIYLRPHSSLPRAKSHPPPPTIRARRLRAPSLNNPRRSQRHHSQTASTGCWTTLGL